VRKGGGHLHTPLKKKHNRRLPTHVQPPSPWRKHPFGDVTALGIPGCLHHRGCLGKWGGALWWDGHRRGAGPTPHLETQRDAVRCALAARYTWPAYSRATSSRSLKEKVGAVHNGVGFWVERRIRAEIRIRDCNFQVNESKVK